MNADDCILFSGGMKGAEAAFGACAEKFGVEEVNFTFEGHPIERHRGVRALNHEELLNGDVSLEYVSKLMHRKYTDAPTIRKVLQTLWYQVNSGQEIYVVGAILPDDTVRGEQVVGAFASMRPVAPSRVADSSRPDRAPGSERLRAQPGPVHKLGDPIRRAARHHSA